MVRVKVKRGGISKLLRSTEVQAEVTRIAERGARAAGPGFTAVTKPHKFTARAFVTTVDDVGRRREADEKVLNRALGAMR